MAVVMLYATQAQVVAPRIGHRRAALDQLRACIRFTHLASATRSGLPMCTGSWDDACACQPCDSCSYGQSRACISLDVHPSLLHAKLAQAPRTHLHTRSCSRQTVIYRNTWALHWSSRHVSPVKVPRSWSVHFYICSAFPANPEQTLTPQQATHLPLLLQAQHIPLPLLQPPAWDLPNPKRFIFPPSKHQPFP